MKLLTRALLLGALITAAVTPAHAQSAPRKFLSAASVNATLVLGTPSILKAGIAANTTAVVYYLKFYNKATAPTCGTDVPVWTVPLPVTSDTSLVVPDGLLFPLGLGFCLTGGIADNDATVAATGVAINLGVTGR